MSATDPRQPEQQEIDLQGMDPGQIAELFATDQYQSAPTPEPVPESQDFPELGAQSRPPVEQQPVVSSPRSEPKQQKQAAPESAAEAIDQLPEFSTTKSSWREKISGRREMIRQQLAGVDPVPPKSGLVLQADPDDPFIKLLRPLPQSEILALSADVARDQTVFQKLEKQRSNQFRSHNLAAVLTALALAIWALAVGPQFLTDTLTNAKIPGWVPIDWPQEIVSGVLFVIGLLVPVASGIALLDGLRWLLAAPSGGIKLLSRSVPGLLCGPLALLLVSQGSILSAVVVLIICWAATVVVSLVTDLGRRRWRKDGS